MMLIMALLGQKVRENLFPEEKTELVTQEREKLGQEENPKPLIPSLAPILKLHLYTWPSQFPWSQPRVTLSGICLFSDFPWASLKVKEGGRRHLWLHLLHPRGLLSHPSPFKSPNTIQWHSIR